jgi:BirA family transcriptional regulator, biotin operon repressor / biotin---[acetyl-CoA-carboxylase] ligase
MNMLQLEEMRSRLQPQVLPTSIEYRAQVGSTMDLVRAQLEAGAPEGMLAVTDEQLAGRGRQGRSWVTPPGSALLFSLGLRPTWLALPEAMTLVWLAAVSLCEGIAEATGLDPQLKWPNDVLLPDPGNPAGRAKTAGILLESHIGEAGLVWAILGCGINVSASPPPDAGLRTSATDLSRSLGAPVDRMAVFAAILQRMDAWYGRLQAGERPALFTAWRNRLISIGHEVTVQTAQGSLQGLALDVETDGALRVRDATGEVHRVTHGDVS